MRKSMKTAAKMAAPQATEAVAKTVEKAVKAAEKTTNAVLEKAEEVKEAVKETTAKKTTTRKATVKETVYLQYLGKEINKDDLVKQIKELWAKERKNKAGDLKSITLYLKPEENRAYYVVNDDVTGSIAL